MFTVEINPEYPTLMFALDHGLPVKSLLASLSHINRGKNLHEWRMEFNSQQRLLCRPMWNWPCHWYFEEVCNNIAVLLVKDAHCRNGWGMFRTPQTAYWWSLHTQPTQLYLWLSMCKRIYYIAFSCIIMDVHTAIFEGRAGWVPY